MKSFNIAGQEIACQEVVKLLGIELDYMLNFDTQVSSSKTIECIATTQQVFICKY